MDRAVKDLLATIDLERFEGIRHRHASGSWAKYLDLPQWLGVNLRRVREAGLDQGAPRRVVDVGCGAGYFLHVCRQFGHDVHGVDIPDEPMYRELVELLGVPVTYARVEPFAPLPGLGRVDVLTAYMITFNGHGTDRVWGPDEWRFFLGDVCAGRVVLELNREPSGVLFTPGLREFFAARGARVAGHRIEIGSS